MRVARGAVLLAIVMLFAVTLLAHSQASAPTITISPITPNSGSVSLSGSVTTSSGATVKSAVVDWGDNKQDTLAAGSTIQASHTYTTTGGYFIIITVTDTNGNTGSAETAVQISQTSSGVPASQPVTASGVHCLANNGDVTDVGACIADSFPISILGLLLSLALVAVSYMAGEVIELGGLKGWYKKELWETAKSALLIGIIFSVLVLASGIATSIAGNPAVFQSASQQSAGTNIVSNLDSLYSTTLTSYIQPQLLASYGAFASDLGLSMGVATLGSVTVSSWLGVPIYVGSVNFGSKASIYTSGYVQPASPTGGSFMKNVMTIIVVPVLLIFQFQNDLLPLIVTIGFAVFLPLGIILRAFPFLRPIGGTMIAIAIGASLVYPTMLIGFNLPISNYFTAATGYGSAPVQNSCSSSIIPGSTILCIFLTGVQNFIADLSPGAPILAATLGSSNVYNFASSSSLPILYNNGFQTGFFGSINSIFPPLNFVLTTVINEILQFILFVFDIVIGLVIVNGVSGALGGVDFGKRRGIGKFKLF